MNRASQNRAELAAVRSGGRFGHRRRRRAPCDFLLEIRSYRRELLGERRVGMLAYEQRAALGAIRQPRIERKPPENRRFG